MQVTYETLYVPSLLQDGKLTASVTEDGISLGEVTICLTAVMENIQDIRPWSIIIIQIVVTCQENSVVTQ